VSIPDPAVSEERHRRWWVDDEPTRRRGWLIFVGQFVLIIAGLLTWVAMWVVWFRVPGATPPANGCPAIGPCSTPYVEVLSGTAAAALGVTTVLMIISGVIPRLAMLGVAAGIAAVASFDYFVYLMPADRPAIVGPVLYQATFLSWLGGVLAIGAAVLILVTRRWQQRRASRMAIVDVSTLIVT
jgi:hypothetical protein